MKSGVPVTRVTQCAAIAMLVIVGVSLGALLPYLTKAKGKSTAARTRVQRLMRLPATNLESPDGLLPKRFWLVSSPPRFGIPTVGMPPLERLPPIELADTSSPHTFVARAPEILPAATTEQQVDDDDRSTASVLKSHTMIAMASPVNAPHIQPIPPSKSGGNVPTVHEPDVDEHVLAGTHETIAPRGFSRSMANESENRERSAMGSAETPRSLVDPQFQRRVQVVLAPTTERVQRDIQHAVVLANRGAVYSARLRLERALHDIAESLDSHLGTQTHREQLGIAMLALREVPDFVSPVGGTPSQVNVARITQRHRSSILNESEAQRLTASEAIQRYHEFAARELSSATGSLPVAAEALFALGKLSLAQSEHSVATKRAHLLAAGTYFRAALQINDRMYLAANELAVLMARDGHLEEARDLLQSSVAARPLPDTWHNLTVVHQRLGDVRQAQQSLASWRLAMEQQHRSESQLITAANGSSVYWVDKSTFESGSLGVRR